MHDVARGRCAAVIVTVTLVWTAPDRAAAQPFIYWTEPGSNAIKRSDINGGNVQTLADASDGVLDPRGIALDPAGGKMYWAERTRIKCANLDGSDVQTLPPGSISEAWGVDIDPIGRKLYWVNSGPGELWRMNLDGTGKQRVAPYSSAHLNPVSLDIDPVAGKVYWVHGLFQLAEGGVRRANLDGTQVESVLANQQFPLDIAVDTAGGKFYFTDRDLGGVVSANLDGSNRTVLTSGGLLIPQGIDLFDFRVYFADTTGRVIWRMNQDGSDRVALLTDVNFPRSLAILVPEPGACMLAIPLIMIALDRRRRPPAL